MVGHKGGKCKHCPKRVTEENISSFHFHHKIPLNNGHEKTDRWGGAVCEWTPFTDKWLAWAQRVELICKDCHHKQHSIQEQMDLDFEAIQGRLDEHSHGTTPTVQDSFFGDAA